LRSRARQPAVATKALWATSEVQVFRPLKARTGARRVLAPLCLAAQTVERR
jgi:hypothetical protein